MNVSYRNTFGDLLAFSFHTHVRSWLIWAAAALLAYSVTTANVAALRQSDVTPPFRLVTFIVVELVLLLGIAALFAVVIVLSNLSRRHKTTLTDHTLTLSADGLREETAYNVTTYTWSAIQKVVRTRRHLLLYVGPNSAHLVPRRAVASPEEWDGLYEMARAYSAASV